jgi:hypothetical protein
VKRFTRILGVASVTVLLSTGVAAAASLGMSSGRLSAGSAAVAGCTSSSLTATRNVNNSGTVTQVSVLNVPQACAGETLAVTLEHRQRIDHDRPVHRRLHRHSQRLRRRLRRQPRRVRPVSRPVDKCAASASHPFASQP